MADYFDGPWIEGALTRSMNYQDLTFAPTTQVRYRPYPADRNYVEIMLPGGICVTETPDRVVANVEAVPGPVSIPDGVDDGVLELPKIIDYRNAWKNALMRSLRQNTNDWSHREGTYNRADPTHWESWTGWVTFLYDPYTELDRDGQPYMGSVYEVEVRDVTWLTQIDIHSAVGSHWRHDEVFNLYDDAPNDDGWLKLDVLLGARFHKDRPSYTWLEESYPLDLEPELRYHSD